MQKLDILTITNIQNNEHSQDYLCTDITITYYRIFLMVTAFGQVQFTHIMHNSIPYYEAHSTNEIYQKETEVTQEITDVMNYTI